MRNNAEDPYYSLVRPEILEKVPLQSKNVLDVGCGYGALGKALKSQRDVKYFGIELSDSAAKQLEQICEEFWIGDIEKLNFEELPHFDCLIAADVLEHLNNPWRILLELVEKLDPNGIAVISIPNIRNLNVLAQLLIKGKWQYENSGILDKTHLRFFTRDSVLQLIADSNLRIESLTYNRDEFTKFRRFVTWPIRRIIPDLEISQFIMVARKFST